MKRAFMYVLAAMLTAMLVMPATSSASVKITNRQVLDRLKGKTEEEPFFQWEGYSLEPLRYRIFKSSGSAPTMYLYFRIINNTDEKLDLWFEDTSIDGTAVVGTSFFDVVPGTDTGENSEEYCMIFPERENKEEGTDAIIHAEEFKATLILTRSEDEEREELFQKEVVVDLTVLDADITIYDEKAESDPEPETKQPETETQTQPAPSYNTLFPGSSGDVVRALQEQLILLGYLNDVADGQYGPKTQAAVKAFNEANGLASSDVATYSTQELAFSGTAKAVEYEEDWIPLDIGDEFSWDAVPEANTFFFRVKVKNNSLLRAIKGYELSVYYTDVWGDKMDGGVTYTQTMPQRVEPGESVYSANFNLGNWYSVDTVWVGVSKIVFDDGEIREAKDIVYHDCVLPSRIN